MVSVYGGRERECARARTYEGASGRENGRGRGEGRKEGRKEGTSPRLLLLKFSEVAASMRYNGTGNIVRLLPDRSMVVNLDVRLGSCSSNALRKAS